MTAPLIVPPAEITIRRGTVADGLAAYRVLFEAINDLAARIGVDPIPGDVESSYARSEPMFRHLAETAAEFWVATDATGDLVGYARSIEHDGFFELTEFFVLPAHQSSGLGRQLLERAFPDGRGEIRVIVATTDVRALARYVKVGMTAQTVIVSLTGAPQAPAGEGRLRLDTVGADDPALREIATLDAEIAGFDRGEDLAWLATTRQALLFRHRGDAAAYAYVAKGGIGPIGARDPDDLPAILDEVLRRAAAVGMETASFEVPMSNGVALRHLLARGLRIDPFMTLLLANRAFGQMDRYVAYSPPVFL